MYNPADPAVLKTDCHVDRSGRAEKRAHQHVRADERQPAYTMLLLGMGLRRFSVAPSAIPEIKNVSRNVTLDQCKTVADKVMTMENAREVKSYLNEELKKHVPGIGQ